MPEKPDRNISFKVDDELFKRIKVRIALADKTLKEYILELILKDLDENK